MTEELVDFPDRWVRPVLATIAPTRAPGRGWCETGHSAWMLDVPLEWFDVREVVRDWEPDEDATSFTFDLLCLPEGGLTAWTNRTFRYPRNPTQGYVDGSIYLMNVHNPVDLVEISFGAADGRDIPAILTAEVQFEVELSGFRDRSFRFAAMFRLASPEVDRAD